MARWKQSRDEAYRFAVQAFFERTDFLRTLQHWILFYVKDSETRKSVLRQHQRRAIDAIIERCAEGERKRGLIWHTQGSGKTFTLLTAGRLEERARFHNATVILVVDRTELEGQLKGWVERLLGEMKALDMATERADSKAKLQNLLDADFRGLIVAMIQRARLAARPRSLGRAVAECTAARPVAVRPKANGMGIGGTGGSHARPSPSAKRRGACSDRVVA